MLKKSKVTKFFIFGIFVLFLILIAYFLKNQTGPEKIQTLTEVPFQKESENVNSYVTGCLADITASSLMEIGKKSGYYTLPEDHFSNQYFETAYLSADNILSLEKISNEISPYIASNKDRCSFKSFKNLNITSNNVKDIRIEYSDTKTIFKINWPIEISSKNKQTNLEKFEFEIPIRLKLIHDSLPEIIENKHPLEIPDNIHINILDFEDSLVYIITDDSSIVNEKSYKFVFAKKITNS